LYHAASYDKQESKSVHGIVAINDLTCVEFGDGSCAFHLSLFNVPWRDARNLFDGVLLSDARVKAMMSSSGGRIIQHADISRAELGTYTSVSLSLYDECRWSFK
jgi:hypothetical protein